MLADVVCQGGELEDALSAGLRERYPLAASFRVAACSAASASPMSAPTRF